MTVKTLVASLVFSALAFSTAAEERTFVGTWQSSDEGAGTFRYSGNGQFVWTDGRVVNTGIWMFDDEGSTISMILDPMQGVDDQARVSFEPGSRRITFSFHRVGGEVQDPPWIAVYERAEE